MPDRKKAASRVGSPDRSKTGKPMEDVEKSISFEDNSLAAKLFGSKNVNLATLAELTGTSVNSRGNRVLIRGDEPQSELARRILKELYELMAGGFPVFAEDVEHAHRIMSRDYKAKLKKIFLDKVLITSGKRTVAPKTVAQKEYIEAVRRNDMVFGIGPAGTGKTYLAMAMAVAALTSGEKRRIVLCRPAVEAGEKLGFLPGDLYEKVNPYLRPLYDALHDLMDFDQADGMVSRGVIEVAPLAFMRGRTLNDSFVILDEAQNTTTEQMKMFLTRLGYSSKAVVTGDVTQIDLPSGKRSGLVQAEMILQGIKGISFVHFSQKDVIRHRLVQEIISAYERADKTARAQGEQRG